MSFFCVHKNFPSIPCFALAGTDTQCPYCAEYQTGKAPPHFKLPVTDTLATTMVLADWGMYKTAANYHD